MLTAGMISASIAIFVHTAWANLKWPWGVKANPYWCVGFGGFRFFGRFQREAKKNAEIHARNLKNDTPKYVDQLFIASSPIAWS